jgi:hypothetical protein
MLARGLKTKPFVKNGDCTVENLCCLPYWMELEAVDWLNVEERSGRIARIAEGQVQ